jgi:hypothetical protein
MVNINGTIQQPYTAYNIVGNNSIVFTEIPLTTDIIEVRTIATGVVAIQNLAFGDTAVSLDAANVNVTGNVLPTANTTYSLGSSNLRWNQLHANVVNASSISTTGNIVVGNYYIPTANNSAGTSGQIVYDNNYVYICVATNTWKRANLATW